MNILEQIIATKRREITSAQAVKSMARIEAETSVLTRQAVSFRKALLASPTGIIAEFKRKSPSKGFIKQEADTAGITASYERAGAAAVSVLTDRDYFAGCLDDLIPARKNLSIPILRKDFIIDPYQICEARIRRRPADRSGTDPGQRPVAGRIRALARAGSTARNPQRTGARAPLRRGGCSRDQQPRPELFPHRSGTLVRTGRAYSGAFR